VSYLATADYAVIVIYFLLLIGPGAYLARKASRNITVDASPSSDLDMCITRIASLHYQQRENSLMCVLIRAMLGLVLCCSVGLACTSAVISGKATADGRPILWKHRDSEFEHNKLRYFQGPRYAFLGVVNSDTLQDEVWMGSNGAGFSIINTAAYNMNVGIQCPRNDEEGIFMREALGACASLADFEQLLRDTEGKRGVDANFGVIDAMGGAAYYEVGCTRWVKFDVNDPEVAPDGYLLRTNFAFEGSQDKRKGTVRFETISRLVEAEYKSRRLSISFILQEADQSLKNAILDRDLALELPDDSSAPKIILFRDFIVRSSSTSSLIVHGVRPGEDPALTTLWTVLGFPLTTPVIAVWVAAGPDLPEMALSSDGRISPINERSLVLKKRCFPLSVDNAYDYLNLAAVFNKAGTGIAQRLVQPNAEIRRRATVLVNGWRRSAFRKMEAVRQYRWVDSLLSSYYHGEFGL
jgi:hypothetical protein